MVAIIKTIPITIISIIVVGEILGAVTPMLLKQLVIHFLNLVFKQTQLLRIITTPTITYLNSLGNQALLRQQQIVIVRLMLSTSLQVSQPKNSNSLTQIQIITTKPLIRMEIFGNSLKATTTTLIIIILKSNK